ncbi:FAD-dependent oxidoreductase [Cellulophaga sp. F20128]|uniref:FAD-dependent oxidoreductase n=1 Tax=Cellulophaga sp. F20128 TaxID=2926413 RepID=UPI001FF62F13|nr:FAD-dependent oxidoreductase [Cellulophaga sp. F20128]MCK0158296.1 FAD-dependent oxidoreductase [Cellulophaga sp. F20128]
MIKSEYSDARDNKLVEITADLVVIGGGLAGVCAAITAARESLKVVLVQDRPVLGGNSSSEVRLWALGATSHMGNNNRWSREGGLINEILLDNLNRNKEGNPLIFDTILLEKVYEENNITLLLNTVVYETQKANDTTIACVKAFCSQNSTTYILQSTYFCDASGDGIVAFQSGASFRMGAETSEEFDEGFAPNIEDYGNLLGHSLYFYTKDVGKPITYKAPSFAIDNAAELPRIKNFQLGDHGCKLWWVEYGGRLDTVHQSEDIKFELWKVVYGIWDYVKNSNKFPEAENLTLEWVGTIPGKRESRRFEGDFMLSQKDIVEQRDHYDRVAIGGWAMDLHPADGIYSAHNSCTQWHGKGIYTIPYRCYYSKDIDNLFLAGRIISASHVAFGSSRVMLTCAHGGQVVGKAAALCLKNNWNPRNLGKKEHIEELQLSLNRDGQGIPRLSLEDQDDLILDGNLTASSELKLSNITASGLYKPLRKNTAQLLPLNANEIYSFKLNVKVLVATTLTIKLKKSNSVKHYTPDIEIQSDEFVLEEGFQEIRFNLNKAFSSNSYVYLCFMENDNIELPLSNQLYSGVITLQQKINKSVSNFGRQDPPENIGIHAFDFWTPERKPAGENIAMLISPPIQKFDVKNVLSLEQRATPNGNVNAWMSAIDDKNPQINCSWSKPQKIKSIKLIFDTDFDNALESILMTHSQSIVDMVVNNYKIFDEKNNLIFECVANYQAINHIKFENPIETSLITIVFEKPNVNIPVSVFKISAYSDH